MTDAMIDKDDTLNKLPPEWPDSQLPAIRDALARLGKKLVVLDDDPTGTQTVYGMPVLTEWDAETLAAALADQATHTFYILTNSRSLPPDEARAVNIEIASNLKKAAVRMGVGFSLVSRSDSTLRGYFPLEPDALESVVSAADIWLLIPFFLEGGRYTLNDIHYVAEGERLIPAAQTPFAQDKAFGYRASNLKEWVAEKSEGRFQANNIYSITLDDLRREGPIFVAQKLLDMRDRAICVVNAASYRDLEVLVRAVLLVEEQGRHFLFRTAASFVRTMSGLDGRPLLSQAELLPNDQAGNHGGLVVVGSYVPKTTSQLNYLIEHAAIEPIEIDVRELLDDQTGVCEIERVVAACRETLFAGKDAVIFTSRTLISSGDAVASLAIGQTVSESLVAIVKSIDLQPRFLIAKGGITSSDVATKGLGIKKALILGQILPGIPVWQTGDESRYPGTNYVVFPGNVGDETALFQAVEKLTN